MLKMCDSAGLQESQMRYNILVQWPPRAENIIQISPQIFSPANNVPSLSKLSFGRGGGEGTKRLAFWELI